MGNKVFISYRHIEPDQQLAHSLNDYLTQQGVSVFVDTKIKVGVEWAAEISQQIQQTDYLILLLSESSVRSDMVRQEIEEARKHNKTILPIRVQYDEELPYDLGAWLNKIQYISWQSEQDSSYLYKQLLQAIQRKSQLPDNPEQTLKPNKSETAAPLPVADIIAETGAVKKDSPFYVERNTDQQAQRHIKRIGSTTIIKAPRQMGKSSLLARLYNTARHNKQKVCYIDLQLLDESHLENLGTLTQYISRKIARAVRSHEKMPQDDDLGPKENLSNFIEDIVLMEAKTPFIFVLDETDRLFQYHYRDDFFSLIRAWHNQRAYDDLWENFNIIIAHSTEPHLWIQDINQSPFNVGERLELHDFNLQQLEWLNQRYGSPLTKESELQALYQLTSGQPYLTRQALYTLTQNGLTLQTLQDQSATDNGPFGDHLRRFAWLLSEHQELKPALEQIIKEQSCDDEKLFLRLRAAGLITGDIASEVNMRNQLYLQYFKKRL